MEAVGALVEALLAFDEDVFHAVLLRLSFVGDLVPLVRDPVPLVSEAVALVSQAVPVIRDPFACLQRGGE